MIINNSNNTGIETVSGEISTYSTTIDPKDLDFITTIDGNGKIVSKHNGYTEGAEEELIEEVRKLVNK